MAKDQSVLEKVEAVEGALAKLKEACRVGGIPTAFSNYTAVYSQYSTYKSALGRGQTALFEEEVNLTAEKHVLQRDIAELKRQSEGNGDIETPPPAVETKKQKRQSRRDQKALKKGNHLEERYQAAITELKVLVDYHLQGAGAKYVDQQPKLIIELYESLCRLTPLVRHKIRKDSENDDVMDACKASMAKHEKWDYRELFNRNRSISDIDPTVLQLAVEQVFDWFIVIGRHLNQNEKTEEVIAAKNKSVGQEVYTLKWEKLRLETSLRAPTPAASPRTPRSARGDSSAKSSPHTPRANEGGDSSHLSISSGGVGSSPLSESGSPRVVRLVIPVVKTEECADDSVSPRDLRTRSGTEGNLEKLHRRRGALSPRSACGLEQNGRRGTVGADGQSR